MITYEASTPLVVGLESLTALDRTRVGDAVALLAETRALGLPVPDGFAVTTRGVAMLADPADRSGMDALREAWSAFREPLLIRLSACVSEDTSAGTGPRTVDGSTWDGMLEGLCEVLRHDLAENPRPSRQTWAVAVLRHPSPGRSALVMTGDPFGRGRRITILTRDGEAATCLGRRRCRWLRALADEVRSGLGHPVDLEVAFDAGGAGWIVDCLPYRPPIWS